MACLLLARLLLASLVGVACAQEPAADAAPMEAERAVMVQSQIALRGVTDERVLQAMRTVQRHAFVPDELRHLAYADSPLPIGHEQTISQPYVVAWMTDALDLKPGQKVLEVGTGSGYQAAVLAELGAVVYTIEIVAPLAERAALTLEAQGYGQVHTRAGDGYRGWPEAAPFDRVLVTAAPDHVPEPLKQQLAVGGRLILPLGSQDAIQHLVVITRVDQDTWTQDQAMPVRFVPMTGEAQQAPGR